MIQLSGKNTNQLLKQCLNQQMRTMSQIKDQQYLPKCQIPTLHFQKSLPRLPIPKLEDTCNRYLAAQRPLLIDEAYRKTEFNVKRFCKTKGALLQDYLIKYDKSHPQTSYISEMWFNMYLKDRQPLPLNYNPIVVMHNSERKELNDQAVKVTNLIISSLRFYNSLKTNILKPDVFHLNPKKSDTKLFYNICSKVPEKFAWYAAYMFNAYPLDMSQYPALFESTRIPQIDKDRILTCNKRSKHVTVQHKGHFYKVNVLNSSFDILPGEEILSSFKAILNNNEKINEYPIGPLTTLGRNEWATLRYQLLDAGNRSNVDVIDSAIFNICLDDVNVDGDRVKITRQFLHSDAINRWFDKSFSLIVTKDGYAGVNFEHSWGDGIAILRYMEEIHKDLTENPVITSAAVPNVDVQPERIDFNLTDHLKNEINEAKKNFSKLTSSLDVNFLIFHGIGKTICKREGVSPDAVMQLAFQVAYHKLTGKCVPTYESCSTAAFKHGRTETIRPCTVATKDMSLVLNQKQSTVSEKDLKGKLNECSQLHGQLTKDAAMGQGFDRHLFALKHFALQNNETCNIFHDPEYAMINHNILSTSTLNSAAILAGAFAPVVPDGLGVAYMIQDDACGAIVTNYLPATDGKGFLDALQRSFEDISKVLNYK